MWKHYLQELSNKTGLEIQDEGGLIYNDPDIAVERPAVGELILSEKDKRIPLLQNARRSSKFSLELWMLIKLEMQLHI